MSTWETLLGTIALALGNGGPAGLLYTYIVAYVGFTLTIASMAEMASMAPTSGLSKKSKSHGRCVLIRTSRWSIPLGI